MELTGIGEKNEIAFAHLCLGRKAGDHDFAVGAIEDGRAAGVALFDCMGEALMLNYIYVLPSFRRRGIATKMVGGFLEEIASSPIAALHINYPEKSEELHGFALSLGFKLYRDGEAYRVPAGSLLSSAALEKMLKGKSAGKVVSIAELTEKDLEYIRNALDKEDLDETIIDDPALSPELSFVVKNPKDGMPAALILCEQGEGLITLQYLINFTDNVKLTVDALRALRDAARVKGLEDHELVFVTMSDNMRRLVDNLIKDKESIICEGSVISGIITLT